MMQRNGDWAYSSLTKAQAFAVLWSGCRWRLSQKNRERCTIFNPTDSLFNSPACEAAYCFFWSLLALRVNSYHGRTNKEKIDSHRRWSELKWGPKTHLQLQMFAKGAAKDNEMKIFENTTLSINLGCFYFTWAFPFQIYTSTLHLHYRSKYCTCLTALVTFQITVFHTLPAQKKCKPCI